jgi:hypothetical protein
MKHLVLILIVTLSCHLAVSGQECSKDLELVNSILEKANLEQVISNPDAIADDYNELKSSLSSIGLSSLKKDAPKMLFLNGKERKSKIKNGERRIFVTTLITGDSLNLTFLNPEMATGFEVTICAHNTKGETKNLSQLIIDDNNLADVFDFSFNGLNSSVVSISVRNTSNNDRVEFGLAANK